MISEFSPQFSKNTKASSSMKIRPVGAALFRADGQTYMTKLVVAFSNFANAPKMAVDKIASCCGSHSKIWMARGSSVMPKFVHNLAKLWKC